MRGSLRKQEEFVMNSVRNLVLGLTLGLMGVVPPATAGALPRGPDLASAQSSDVVLVRDAWRGGGGNWGGYRGSYRPAYSGYRPYYPRYYGGNTRSYYRPYYGNYHRPYYGNYYRPYYSWPYYSGTYIGLSYYPYYAGYYGGYYGSYDPYYQYYQPYYPRTYYPRTAYRTTASYDRHEQWCLNHYRSYNPANNTFLSYSGVYKACRSPWR